MLEKFNMKNAYSQNTPMETRQVSNRNKRKKLENPKINEKKSNNIIKRVPYREAIGSLIDLTNATRPDIPYSVNFLERKQIEHTEQDWNDVWRIFRYLRGTTDQGLRYLSRLNKLEAFTDSSCRDLPGSISTCRYVIRSFGDTIAWRSRKQQYVSLSTCFAEYLAINDTCQELISLDKSIRNITGETFYSVTVWCDNKAALDCT